MGFRVRRTFRILPGWRVNVRHTLAHELGHVVRQPLLRCALILAAGALSACQAEKPPEFRPGSFPQLGACKLGQIGEKNRAETIKAVAKAYVTRILRDPESARFPRPLMYAVVDCNEGRHEIVCSFVNAKNAMGGYAGEELFAFVITGDEFAVALYPATRPTAADIGVLTELRDATKICGEAQDAGRPSN